MGWERAVNRMCGGFADCAGPGTGEAGFQGPSLRPPGVLGAHQCGPLPGDLTALRSLPSPLLRPRIPASGCGRAGGCRGAWGGGGRGGRKGRGAPQTPAGRKEPTESLGTVRLPILPAMWGLLLAVTAFAPSVGLGLGAPSASVLGLTPGSTLAPHSSIAQPSTKANGELWVPWSAAGQVRPTPQLGPPACPVNRTHTALGNGC